MKNLAKKIAEKALKKNAGRISMVAVIKATKDRKPKHYFGLIEAVMKLVQRDKRLSLVPVSI